MKTTTCCCLVLFFAAPSFPQDFKFEIGSPVAAQDFRLKAAPFVFRTSGCSEPSVALVTAKAEGLVGGARQSITLRVAPSSKPGVYGVLPSGPPGAGPSFCKVPAEPPRQAQSFPLALPVLSGTPPNS
jgi:hypothetical protein